MKAKDTLITDEINKAAARMQNIKGEETKVFNAIDHIVHRESQQAAKDNRKPEFNSNAMIAEVRY